ncbi:MAG: HDOD domain-containing protein [Candidatus Hydrogenedentes bacterium]|nr:HDOD domain-containing protein [Candidatus Hydrogenedentota bacterium]
MGGAKTYDIDTLLDEVITLPSLPDSVHRINELIEDPDCQLGDIAHVISGDPAIAIKTLRLVNSAYYGLGQEVATVEHAVVLLGVKVIKNLATTATVFEAMKGSATQFLQHSIATGVAMKSFVDHGPLKGMLGSGDEAFIFGLLHDIGKVILQEYLPDAYREVAGYVRDNKVAWHVAEQHLIGVDHASLGARLAAKWKLSKPLIHAIAGHHNFQAADEDCRKIAAALAIADLLASKTGLPSYEDPVFNLSPECWERSGLRGDDLVRAVGGFFDDFGTVNELMVLAH